MQNRDNKKTIKTKNNTEEKKQEKQRKPRKFKKKRGGRWVGGADKIWASSMKMYISFETRQLFLFFFSSNNTIY